VFCDRDRLSYSAKRAKTKNLRFLALTACEVIFDTIQRTTRSSITLEGIIGTLEQILQTKLVRRQIEDESASKIANAIALRETESPLTIFSKMETPQKVVLGILMAFFLISTALFAYGKLDESQYYEGIIVVIIGGVLDFIPNIAESLTRKRTIKRVVKEYE